MIMHIYKLCWNQRGSNGWIWAEMLIVSLVLWVVVDMLYIHLNTFFQPIGHNVENVFKISFSTIPVNIEDKEVTKKDFQTILNRIEAHPDVEVLSYSIHSIPYNHGINTNTLVRDSVVQTNAQIRVVSSSFFDVFQVSKDENNINTLSSLLKDKSDVILSDNTAKELFGDKKSSIGKRLYNNQNDSTDYYDIIGTIPVFRRADFENQNNFYFNNLELNQLTEDISLSNIPGIEICVRVKPEAAEEFAIRFDKEMNQALKVGNIYMMNIDSFPILKKLYNRPVVSGLKQMSILALFLLVNIFLGIVGTFWIRTQYRKGEMGLRIATGSTRKKLILLLIGEGMVLLAISFIPATLIGLNIGLFELLNIDLMPFTATRFLITQSVSLVLMATMICIGILIPTYQYTKLHPAEALRYE